MVPMSERDTTVSGSGDEGGNAAPDAATDAGTDAVTDAATGTARRKAPPSERIIGGRYRLGARRGIGLDIAIFEAVDLVTSDTVAIKIIHPDICAGAGFSERFETVIERLMRSRHPNLVEVLGAGAATWGGHRVFYVVCENLNGGSLRDLRDRRRSISPSQAVMVGLDVCRGLDVAHRAGLVHGDIRPGNVVFGDDGRLRIADLGLAALVAEERHVDPTAMNIDRARYASPERALGQTVVPASDVYSLCLCLVEAVTGVLPFVGDSTVATLANRVDRLMPVSADLGALAAVLERAGRPEPADRSSASEFGRGLLQAAQKLPRPAPMALLSAGLFAQAPSAGGGGTSPTDSRRRPTETSPLSPAIPATAIPATAMVAAELVADGAVADGAADPANRVNHAGIPCPVNDAAAESGAGPVGGAGPVAGSAPVEGPGSVTGGAGRAGAETPTPQREVPPPPQPDVAPPLLRERRSRRKLIAVVAVLLVAAGAGGALAWALGRTTSNPIPVLVGMREGEALNMISEFGWNVAIVSEASDDVAAGVVISTAPAAGTLLDEAADFVITVSSGPAPRVLPELVGLTVERATSALDQLGLGIQLRDEPFSETVPTGVIVSWSIPDQPSLAAGDTVLPGTNIVVSVSAGPQPRIVPDLTGFALPDATAQLQALGLTVVQVPDEFSDQALGAVTRQDPPPGASVARSTSVTITLSKGPDLVAIPALAELNLQQATDALTTAGLVVGSVVGDQAGIVVLAEANGVALAANTTLPRGTAIDLTLEVPVPPTTIPPPTLTPEPTTV